MTLRIVAVVLVMVSVLAGQAFSQMQPPPPAPPAPTQPPGDQPPPSQQPPAQPQQPAPTPPSTPEQPAPQAPPAPPPTEIIPGVGIAGVRIGGNARALRVRFGLPSHQLERGQYVVHMYNRFGLVVYARADVVAAVATTNSLFTLGESLRVGSPAADARAAFGAPSAEGAVAGFQGALYEDRGVGFGIDGGMIATIIVFRPGEARAIPPL